MSVHRPRVLFLGLDAMDPDLVRQWARAGILPAFRALFERATFGATRNPPGLFVGAVWPSFFTGTSPARHGRYCYEQIVPGTYEVRRFPASSLKRAPFWSRLGSAGRRCAIVDAPKSPPTENLNGVQLLDWGTHDPDRGSAFRTWPPPLAAELTGRFGSDPVGSCNGIERDAPAIAAFRQNLEARVRTKTAICRDLLERESWDFFLAVFAESHCVGHQRWSLHDETQPSHDELLARVVGDPLKDVYVALDAAVGELLASAGPDTVVFVLASHGMGPHYDGTFLLEEILERLDPRPGAWMRALGAKTRRFERALMRRVRPGTPLPVRLPVAHRRFFSVPNNDVYGGIRVNLSGREPRGRVHPGKDLDALFAEVRRELLKVVNVDTGQPAVRDVLRVADLYRGECMDDLPDFCVEWNREAPLSCVSSPTIGTVRKQFPGVRSGDHKPDGFFWCAGPGIRPGHRIEPVSVTDFAATVAALLDVPLPDVDGRPITAVLRDGQGPPVDGASRRPPRLL